MFVAGVAVPGRNWPIVLPVLGSGRHLLAYCDTAVGFNAGCAVWKSETLIPGPCSMRGLLGASIVPGTRDVAFIVSGVGIPGAAAGGGFGGPISCGGAPLGSIVAPPGPVNDRDLDGAPPNTEADTARLIRKVGGFISSTPEVSVHRTSIPAAPPTTPAPWVRTAPSLEPWLAV